LRGSKDFSREAGNGPTETASVYEIVDRCLELQGSRFEQHDVGLRIDLTPGLPYVECRETQIGQIITIWLTMHSTRWPPEMGPTAG
jgi:C4-dicarboxylate-specific signal transduction histidine kinase